MGMGGCEVQLSASKSSVRKPPTGLQIVKNGGCIKPRIIHTYSPKVYKIEPEEFLDLVQKLTGRPASSEDEDSCMMSDMSPTSCNTVMSLSPTSTYQFFGNESAKSERSVSDEDSSMSSPPPEYEREFQILKPTSEALGTPVSSQLLASLHKPKFVTLDLFQKFSSNPISSFNQSRREGSFTFQSTAY
jgi:hypothetical protein